MRTLARTVLLSLAIPGSAFRLPVPAVHRQPRLGAGSAGPIHSSFDPLGLSDVRPISFQGPSAAALAGASPLLLCVGHAGAAPGNFDADSIKNAITQAAMDPSTFQPVCPASDGLYRFGQTLVVTVVGPDNYKEYAPLIAGGLLRVRLELCVVESFAYEAVIPFVKEKGLSWILPLHETVETFLAGVIFAIASNFILIGSTKIVTVIATYADVLIGFPIRLVGGIGWRALEDNVAQPVVEKAERPQGIWALFERPPPRAVPPLAKVWKANSDNPASIFGLFSFGTLRAVGEVSGGIRRAVEAVDFFVGRYLLLSTVAYVGFKFVHYKIFDPFPF